MTLRKQWGYSIIQVSFVMVMAAGAALVVFKTLSDSSETIQSSQSATDSASLASSILLRSQNMTTAIGAQKDKAYCSLMSTKATSGGVGLIEIGYPNADSEENVFPWNRFFPPADFPELTNSEYRNFDQCNKSIYERCFHIADGNSIVTDLFRSKKPVIRVQLVPAFVRNNDPSVALNKVALKSNQVAYVNARDTALANVVTIFSDKTGSDVKSSFSLNAFVWAGNLSCKYKLPDGRNLLLNPSGIGSGVSGNTLFSDTVVDKRDDLTTIQTTFVRYEANTWRVESGNFVSDKSIRPVAAKCWEQKFQCRGASSRVWRRPKVIDTKVKFNRSQEYDKPVLRTKLAFKLKNGKGDTAPTGRESFRFNEVLIDRESNVVNLRAGILEKVSVLPPAGINHCTAICQEQPDDADIYFNYPLTEAGKLKAFRPSMFYQHVNRDGEVLASFESTEDQDFPVACSCCFAKQCYGGGTSYTNSCYLGPPVEPLDARFSECEGQENANLEMDAPYRDMMIGTVEPNLCVAARINSVTNKLELKTLDCSRRKPGLCFFQGSIFAARQLGESGLLNNDFAGFREACSKLAIERMRKFDLDERLTEQGNFSEREMPSTVGTGRGTRYEFLNAAKASLFMAPQGEFLWKEAKGAIRAALRAAPTEEWFWIGLRTDNSSAAISIPPVSMGEYSPYSFHWTPNWVLEFNKDPDHTYGSGNFGLAVNSRRYVGVLYVRSGSETVASDPEFPVLCKRPGKAGENQRQFFRSRVKTRDWRSGVAICAAEAGIFAEPLTAMEWSNALLKVKEPNEFYPWPAGAGDFDSTPPGAWVAVQKTGPLNWSTPLSLGVGGTNTITVTGNDSPSTRFDKRLCYNEAEDRFILKSNSATDLCDTLAGEKPVKQGIGSRGRFWKRELFAFLQREVNAGNLRGDSLIDINNSPSI